MSEFQPKIKHESFLTVPKPKIGDRFRAGVVVNHTIGGFNICLNQYTGISEKKINCPICPDKKSCRVAEVLNIA